MTDRKQQQALYPHDDLADWIEETAEKSDRSQSYVLCSILDDIRQSLNDKPVDVNHIDFTIHHNSSTDMAKDD